jgi:hypothetical protein
MTIPDLTGLPARADAAAREARIFRVLSYAASRPRAARTVSRARSAFSICCFFFGVFDDRNGGVEHREGFVQHGTIARFVPHQA